jgi:hypothetical protein
MRNLFTLLLVSLLLLPATSMAAPTLEELQKQIQDLSSEIEDMSALVEKNETHVAKDRIEWYGDLRAKADSVHYEDVTFNPGIKVDFTDFFMKAGAAFDPSLAHPLGDITVFTPTGDPNNPFTFDPSDPSTALDNLFVNLFNNDPAAFTQLTTMMAGFDPTNPATFPGVGNFRLATAPKTYNVSNDILYTSRLRLGMKAKVAKNIDFSGRLTMYKNWGDSTGVKVFDSWNTFTMDGTNSGNTTGDGLHVERAMFVWNDIADSNFYLSIGRRPSTYGMPTNYRENEQRGGTPSGHLVNFNFDGVTIGYKLSKVTGVEGQTVRFCYGQGFESEFGNGELFGNIDTTDTHLGGFNIDLINNGMHAVQLTAFRAQDINDGFKGVFAFPTEFAPLFAPTLNADMQKFPTFNFVTRFQPSATIGHINLAGLGYAYEAFNGASFFGSAGYTGSESTGKAGMFGGMLADAVFEPQLSLDGSEVIMMPVRAENDKDRDGYGAYVGMQIPAPMGKVGLEYNYGSRYWTPFTQAQDDVIGSKLATRGHVGEAYYIFDINPRAFIKVGGLYYDYEYTGSGSPVGEPKKVDDVLAGTEHSLLPVVDTAWDAYASMTVKF